MSISAFVLDKVSTEPSSIEWDDEKMIGTDKEEREEAVNANNDTSNMETEVNGSTEVVGVGGIVEMDKDDAGLVMELDGDIHLVDNPVDFEIDLGGQ